MKSWNLIETELLFYYILEKKNRFAIGVLTHAQPKVLSKLSSVVNIIILKLHPSRDTTVSVTNFDKG
jgi:hypothetical protein